MPERLTPEQLALLTDREVDIRANLQPASGPFHGWSDTAILYAHEVRKLRRTLQRVQQWTEQEVPTHITSGDYRIRRSVLSIKSEQDGRAAVAALLRAEEES